MKKGFTLIEIIVAVAILSVVGLALLQIASDKTKLIGALKEKSKLPLYLSTAAFHGSKDLHKLDKDLYTLLSGSYTIDHDRAKKKLESMKMHYEEQIHSRIVFGQSEEGAAVDGGVLQIDIVRQQVRTDRFTGSVFTFRP